MSPFSRPLSKRTFWLLVVAQVLILLLVVGLVLLFRGHAVEVHVDVSGECYLEIVIDEYAPGEAAYENDFNNRLTQGEFWMK